MAVALSARVTPVRAGSAMPSTPPSPDTTSPSPADAARVVPVFYVPRDMSFTRADVEHNIRALDDVRSWYADRLGGPTFRAEPLIVLRSRHTFAELAGAEFQNWWPLPAAELASHGLPWNERSSIKLLILARGGGAWAGADSENGGIDSIAQAGRVPRGDLGGLAVVGDSSVRGVLSGVCPREGVASHRKPEGGTAWWCNWNTYRGTLAHELGHTWGLPHPDAFRAGFRCDSTTSVNMQCHWAWPNDSLLPYEADHLRSLSHFSGRGGPEYVMLSMRPVRVTHGQLRTVVFERGDSLLWAAGRGTGVGFPWGVQLTTSGRGRASSRVSVARAAWLAAEIGRPPGESGVVLVRVRAGGRVVMEGEISADGLPLRLVASVEGATSITLEALGPPGAGIVFGNARLYPRDR